MADFEAACNRIHDRLDGIEKQQTNILVKLAKIEDYRQPCDTMVDHLRHHEQTTKSAWSIVAQIGGAAVTGALGALAAWIGLGKG